MNKEQLKRIYAMMSNIKAELKTDPKDTMDIQDALNDLGMTVVKELQDIVWNEYHTTELKRFDT